MMQSEISGTERLKLAKHVIDQNYITAMQVKELVTLFGSTDRALELANMPIQKPSIRTGSLLYMPLSPAKAQEIN